MAQAWRTLFDSIKKITILKLKRDTGIFEDIGNHLKVSLSDIHK